VNLEMPMVGMKLSSLMVAVVLALGLAGCNRATTVQVPVQGVRLPADRGMIVDVSNWNGSVYVVADSKAKGPDVAATVRPTKRNFWKKEGDLVSAVDVKATASFGDFGRKLTVVSQPATQPPGPVAVDLYIRVPKTTETHVRNSGGEVEIVRTDGPVDVENGVGAGPGGDIQVRTGAAMIGPSTMTTTSGKVLYQVGPGSMGDFRLMADKGPPPQFSSRIGETTEVRPEELQYRCILNGGKNQIVLHSGDGLVRATCMEDAAEYGPELWDGEFRWPKEPRIIGRLGGYYNDEPARLWPKREQ
jgi:hypothetical protein